MRRTDYRTISPRGIFVPSNPACRRRRLHASSMFRPSYSISWNARIRRVLEAGERDLRCGDIWAEINCEIHQIRNRNLKEMKWGLYLKDRVEYKRGCLKRGILCSAKRSGSEAILYFKLEVKLELHGIWNIVWLTLQILIQSPDLRRDFESFDFFIALSSYMHTLGMRRSGICNFCAFNQQCSLMLDESHVMQTT